MEGGTPSRKLDHIRITVERDVESRTTTLLEYVRIQHNPAPEIDLADVDTSIRLFGKELRAPLMITAMTGGHPEVEWVNEALARVAERHGIALGVGSQRAAIEDPSLAKTFRVVRDNAPKALIVANIGAPQLSRGYGVREARIAVEMIEADALAIHLNPAQEAFQLEGDPHYRGVMRAVKSIVDELGVPVIIKETGTGLSGEAAAQFWGLGVECFDVAGLGGTNWVKVELLRSHEKTGDDSGVGVDFGDYWGNPTAVAVAEIRAAVPEACIIASGGLRTGLDVARAIALGADIGGVALPALRALFRGGEEELDRYISGLKRELSTAMFLAGARSVEELQLARVTVWGRLRDELESLGLSLGDLDMAKLRRVLHKKRVVQGLE